MVLVVDPGGALADILVLRGSGVAAFDEGAQAGSPSLRSEASKTFRELRGYKGMPTLLAALRAHDATLKPRSIDGAKRAA